MNDKNKLSKEQLAVLEKGISKSLDSVLEKKLKPLIGEIAAAETKKIVQDMRIERSLFGQDRSGLNKAQKKDFVYAVREIVNGLGSQIDTKANEALISEQDNRGGFLVATEVANAIVRIAASVGLIMSQAMKWPMGTDQLDIPAYTGAFLEGEYLGMDAAGSVTAMEFGTANLIVKKWQLAFVVGNDLLQDATVDLADWLLAIGGESLANMVDKQGFAGIGSPFVGILQDDDIAVETLATGKDTFAEFDVISDSSTMIGSLEESVLEGAAFYMNRTVWASLRTQEDTAGNPLLPQGGAPSQALLTNNPTGGGTRPAGEILGFPVFTTRHMPALSASAVSTKFLAFGNMKAMAFGDKGEFRVNQFESGSFGGKEVALADQRAIVYKHRHALVIALAAAFVVAKTAAS